MPKTYGLAAAHEKVQEKAKKIEKEFEKSF